MAKPWQRLLETAETTLPNVYAATYFNKEFISIVDQQIRSFNLCYALVESRKVKNESHIAIIGGGISGITCAVALAMLRNCVVYVFEQDTILLRRLREGTDRYLHPDLSHRGNYDRNFQFSPDKRTTFAFMNWAGNYAPLVAEELVRKFDYYRAVANIALYLDARVDNIDTKNAKPALAIDRRQLTFDAVILATGFGHERTNSYTNDRSYWRSGRAEHYQPATVRTSPERILISGNGDSGVVELAHYLIPEFKHEQMFTYLPSADIASSLAHVYEDYVQNLTFKAIEQGSENYPDVPGPIGWYWEQREIEEHNRGTLSQRFDRRSPKGRLQLKIVNTIHDHLHAYRPDVPLPPALIQQIEEKIDPLLDQLATYEINEFVGWFKLSKIYSQEFRRIFKRQYHVTVIGSTRTIYSRKQAPLNWYLLKVLETYGDFTYRQARFQTAKRYKGRLQATLTRNGKRFKQSFDRIVLRHGPDWSVLGYEGVTQRNPQSRYLRTDNSALGLTFDGAEQRDVDRFLTYFRTERWQQALRRNPPFDDLSESDRTPEALFPHSRHLDHWLLELNAKGQHQRGGALYRKAKQVDDRTAKYRMLSRMQKLYAATQPASQ